MPKRGRVLRAGNPLFVWRSTHNWTRMQIAREFGLHSVTTVYNWESGITNPGPFFTEIARLMKIKERTLREEWEAWQYS